MDLNLNGKVAVVTGGAKGIGEGIVRAFAAEGAITAIIDKNEEAGNELASTLSSAGHISHFIKAELTQEEACANAIKTIREKLQSIDILVNNAGINDGVGLDKPPAEFMESINKNLFHVYALTHHALEDLKKSKGVITNISSKVSLTGQSGTSGYAASKGGVNALTREWALDLSKHGIRVNCVLPAEVWTPLYENWINTFDDPEAQLKKIVKNIPFENRFTTKEEIADTVVFLSSSRSSHTTGQIVHVDGGYAHFDRASTAN